MTGKYLTVREVSERFRISEKSVIRMITARDLHAVRFGALYRVPITALQERESVPAVKQP